MTTNSAAYSIPAPAVLRDRFEIREARESDNDDLLALTRATPMAGTISLRIDRDPDFFALLRLRGEGKVFIAVRGGREVVGCISAALRTAYIAGNPETVAYIADMKVHPRVSGTRTALRLMQALETYVRSTSVDLCFSVVAQGNHRAMSLFEGRLGIPPWVPLGRFLVDELIPSPFTNSRGPYSIEPAGPQHLPEIAALLDRFHRVRQFAPRLSEDEIARALSSNADEPFSKTLLARAGNRIVATLTLYDTLPVKRNVLLDAPAPMRALLPLARIAAAPFSRVSIPRIGDPLHLLYARYLACKDEHQRALKQLLAHARAEAFARKFTFLALGLHQQDPLRILTRGIPKVTFTSLAFAASLTAPKRLEALRSGIPFEDYALV